MQNDFDSLRKKLIEDISMYYAADQSRVDHAKKVLAYAEKILREEQADPYVVIPAALMYDIGIDAADAPAIVGRMLAEMEYEDSSMYEICAIIARRHAPRTMEDTNFKVVYDADILAAMDDARRGNKGGRKKTGAEKLLTESGRRLAEEM